MLIKKCFCLLLWASLAVAIVLSGSATALTANAFEIVAPIPASETLPSQLPLVDIWPGNNALGPPDLTGNPFSLSFTIDNADRSLMDLDLQRLGLFVNDIDITLVLFSLPLNAYLFSNNRIVINIRDLALPAATYAFRLEAANLNEPLRSITRTLTVQKDRGFHVGMHIPPVEDGIPPYNDWSVEINRFNELSGRHHTLIMYYTSWADEKNNYNPFDSFLNDQIVGMGAVPLITWEPWRAGGGSEQPEYGLEAIASGRHDQFIQKFAQDCVTFGKPIMLRIMHEFNGVYYPWSGYRNNNDPKLFIAAFRHIVDIFRRQNATNVTFMWSPNYAADQRVPYPSNDIGAYYPGDAYVDWIGASGYNWGTDTRIQAQGWLDFMQIYDSVLFGNFLSTMQENYPDKKIIIAEIGSNEGDQNHSKALWIRDAYASMGRYTNIGGVTWFNNMADHDAISLPADFRIMRNPGDITSPGEDIMEAYRLAVNPDVPPLPPVSTPVYRFDALNSPHHVFTANTAEKDALMAAMRYAGIVFNAFHAQVPETQPVYRLRNSTNSGHYYTIDAAERSRLLASGRMWEDVGIAWYAWSAPAPDAIPCYRFRYHNLSLHFYTANPDDIALYTASSSWISEGIVFYVMPPSS